MAEQDWHEAQVIEATPPLGGRRVLVLDQDGMYQVVPVPVHGGWYPADLSDVRVIVDAEGRMAPPEITEAAAERLSRLLWPTGPSRFALARAALREALGHHDG